MSVALDNGLSYLFLFFLFSLPFLFLILLSCLSVLSLFTSVCLLFVSPFLSHFFPFSFLLSSFPSPFSFFALPHFLLLPFPLFSFLPLSLPSLPLSHFSSFLSSLPSLPLPPTQGALVCMHLCLRMVVSHTNLLTLHCCHVHDWLHHWPWRPSP